MKPIIPLLLLTVTLLGSWLVTTMGDTNPLWSFIIFGAIIIYVIDKWRKNKNEDKVILKRMKNAQEVAEANGYILKCRGEFYKATSFEHIELSKKVNPFVKIEINISRHKGGEMRFSVETPHKFRDKNDKPQHCYNFTDLPVHGDLLEKIEDDIVSGAYFKNRTKRGFVLNNSEL
jgi:hypothetical protein